MEDSDQRETEDKATEETQGDIEAANGDLKQEPISAEIEEKTIQSQPSVANWDFQHPPKRLQKSEDVFGKHFTRGCKWSPDGLCVMTASDDYHLRIFDLPNKDSKTDSELKPSVTMKEGGPLYDFQWYPKLDSSRPETCCLATTSQYQPIHLYDAFDGHIRATYRCYDHVDEVTAARCVNFDPDGTRLLAGLKNQVRIFDVAIPGRDCETLHTFEKNSSDKCLTGIISSIAFNPAMVRVFALASYGKSLAVYLDPRAQVLCQLEGQQGGITHIQFSPDGTKLLAGGRKDHEISVWDMRNPGELYAVLRRSVDTNQRIYFDMTPSGQHVVSGGTDGILRVWDFHSGHVSKEGVLREHATLDNLHSDCINGVSVHPFLPYIATSSGQRHVKEPMIDSDSENDADVEKVAYENSLKLWHFTDGQQ